MQRKQIKQFKKDLEKKMVFIVGPRQVGKTWLAKEIAKDFKNAVYLNYDSFEDRKIIEDERWLQTTDLLILDELHKKKDWKNYLKGVYDTKKDNLKILVTGSARLNTFKIGGDSLAGRFFLHRLLPFSLSELKEHNYGIDKYIERGGFPEPFLVKDLVESNRWRNQYKDGLIRNDILDFEKIHDFRAIETVFELLRRNVASPLSLNSIARDVGISPTTVNKYVKIFEALYIIFRVSPYSRNIARSILKESKIYFYDNGLVIGDIGAKIENLAATSLLKATLAKNDYLGQENNLNYLRTKDGKEVDFALVNSDNRLEKIIEIKHKDNKISKNLKYFVDKYNIPGLQLVKDLKREFSADNIKVLNLENYLKNLFL
jgi:hypothetical protein